MEHVQWARQHVEIAVCQTAMSADIIGCVMESASQIACPAMENVKMEKCSVETGADKMMDTGDLAMKHASIKQRLVMGCVRRTVLCVETVQGALLRMISPLSNAMVIAFHI